MSPGILDGGPGLAHAPESVHGQPVHDRRRPPVGHTEPGPQVIEERLAPLEQGADTLEPQVAGLVLRPWWLPRETQFGQLSPEIALAGKRGPVPVTRDLGAVCLLKPPKLVTLRLARVGVEGRRFLRPQQVHRLLQLACQEILPLGVRPTRLIGRLLRRLPP